MSAISGVSAAGRIRLERIQSAVVYKALVPLSLSPLVPGVLQIAIAAEVLNNGGGRFAAIHGVEMDARNAVLQ